VYSLFKRRMLRSDLHQLSQDLNFRINVQMSTNYSTGILPKCNANTTGIQFNVCLKLTKNCQFNLAHRAKLKWETRES